MARFRDIKTLQTFTSVHASIHNHFNHQRHLNRRDIFKQGAVLQLSKSGKRAIGRVGRAPSHAATSNKLLMN